MIEIDILPKVEFLFTPAIQQNRLPLVRKISIENLTDIHVNADLIQKMGADIDTSITKRTNFVVTGSALGPSKMKKIEQLNAGGYNIRVVYVEEFLSILRILMFQICHLKLHQDMIQIQLAENMTN